MGKQTDITGAGRLIDVEVCHPVTQPVEPASEEGTDASNRNEVGNAREAHITAERVIPRQTRAVDALQRGSVLNHAVAVVVDSQRS